MYDGGSLCNVIVRRIMLSYGVMAEICKKVRANGGPFD